MYNKMKGDKMKNLIKGAALLILAVTFAACQQAADPVSPVSLDKSSTKLTDEPTTGTFEITFPDSRATDQKGIISGSIYFKFDEAASAYKYKGRINTPSETIHSGTFENTGTFTRKGDYINLIDDPVATATSERQTLHLNGDFQYTVRGPQTIIEGNTKIGHLKIVLY